MTKPMPPGLRRGGARATGGLVLLATTGTTLVVATGLGALGPIPGSPGGWDWPGGPSQLQITLPTHHGAPHHATGNPAPTPAPVFRLTAASLPLAALPSAAAPVQPPITITVAGGAGVPSNPGSGGDGVGGPGGGGSGGGDGGHGHFGHGPGSHGGSGHGSLGGHGCSGHHDGDDKDATSRTDHHKHQDGDDERCDSGEHHAAHSAKQSHHGSAHGHGTLGHRGDKDGRQGHDKDVDHDAGRHSDTPPTSVLSTGHAGATLGSEGLFVPPLG